MPRQYEKFGSTEITGISILADFPPPVHGMNTVTSWVIEVLNATDSRLSYFRTSAVPGAYYRVRRVATFVVAVAKLAKSSRGKVIYIPLAAGSALIPQTLAILLVRRRAARIIVHHHSYKPITCPKSILFRITHRSLALNAEHIFLSEEMRVGYQAVWGKLTNSWILNNAGVAYKRAKFDLIYQVLDSKFLTCVHFGNLSYEKGTHLTLLAFQKVLGISNRTRCFLAGPTKDLDLKNEIEQMINKFQSRFTYLESYDETQLHALLAESDFMFFPSNYANEASPLVVLEAQSAGIICFTSDLGCLPEDVLRPGFAVPLDKWMDLVLNSVQEFLAQSDARKEKMLTRTKKNLRRELAERSEISYQQINLIFELEK